METSSEELHSFRLRCKRLVIKLLALLQDLPTTRMVNWLTAHLLPSKRNKISKHLLLKLSRTTSGQLISKVVITLYRCYKEQYFGWTWIGFSWCHWDFHANWRRSRIHHFCWNIAIFHKSEPLHHLYYASRSL